MKEKKPTKEILANNLNQLMAATTSLESNPKLAKASKLGLGTIARARHADVAVTLDTLDALAACFDLPPHQMLVDSPDLPPITEKLPSNRLEIQVENETSALSPESVNLAVFFDMLTDRIDRAIVQNLAMTEILRLLDLRGDLPKTTPEPVDAVKKLAA